MVNNYLKVNGKPVLFFDDTRPSEIERVKGAIQLAKAEHEELRKMVGKRDKEAGPILRLCTWRAPSIPITTGESIGVVFIP